MICKHADRDVPGLQCGHPLPCPHHTYIVFPGNPTIVAHSKEVSDAPVDRLSEIGHALDAQEGTPNE